MAKLHKIKMVYKIKDLFSGKSENSGSKHVQVLVAMTACLPLLSYGTSVGWISPYRELLMGENSPSYPPLTEADISWMSAVLFLPGPLTVFLYGAMVDKYGRKMALFWSNLPILLGWALMLLWNNAVGYILGRTLIGFGSGGAFVACPLYIKEISEDSIRGTVGIFVALSVTFGNLMVFILGDLLPFYPVLWILLAAPSLYLVILMWLPDSPSFLIEKRKQEKAAQALGWLRSLPPDDARIQENIDKLIKERGNAAPKFAPRLLLADKTAMKAFWIALTVNLAREFCGCLAVIMYASDIFSAASKVPGAAVRLTSNQQSTIVAMSQVIGSILSMQIVDRAGRKPLLLVTSLAAASSMLLLGSWFLLAQHSIYLPGWVPILGLSASIFSDATALQSLPYVIMTEMFSFQLRGTVATIILSISFFTDFALLRLFAPLISWIGYHYTFFMFGFFMFAYFLYIVFFVPETKMRDLEVIYLELQSKKRNWFTETRQ